MFTLYVAWKRGLPKKIASFVLFHQINKHSLNLLCILKLARVESTFFLLLKPFSSYVHVHEPLTTERPTFITTHKRRVAGLYPQTNDTATWMEQNTTHYKAEKKKTNNSSFIHNFSPCCNIVFWLTYLSHLKFSYQKIRLLSQKKTSGNKPVLPSLKGSS